MNKTALCSNTPSDISLAVVAIVLLVGVLGYGGYRYNLLWDEKLTLKTKISFLESDLAVTEGDLAVAIGVGEDLAHTLDIEQGKLRALGEEVEELEEEVDVLEKLTTIDPELLQKYSKVFFLNEHYTPSKLTEIPLEHLYHEDEPEYIHTEVWPHLEDLFEEAAEDKVTLWIVSAYRSFEAQSDLKGQYTVVYGLGANQFSADQGYSEHQLGTTVDFTTEGLGGGLRDFDDATAYQWLLENAHRYGFVLSYPERNAFYIFEPWHWRFVGRDLARDLHRDNMYFYDLDQRDIDEYLIKIFD